MNIQGIPFALGPCTHWEAAAERRTTVFSDNTWGRVQVPVPDFAS